MIVHKGGNPEWKEDTKLIHPMTLCSYRTVENIMKVIIFSFLCELIVYFSCSRVCILCWRELRKNQSAECYCDRKLVCPCRFILSYKSLFISSPCEAESGLSGLKIILHTLQRVSERTGLCRGRTGVLKNSSDVTSWWMKPTDCYQMTSWQYSVRWAMFFSSYLSLACVARCIKHPGDNDQLQMFVAVICLSLWSAQFKLFQTLLGT